MKKNLLKKVLALTLSATLAFAPVVTYASEEITEEVVWEEAAGEEQSSGEEASEEQLYSDDQSYSGDEEATLDEPEVVGFEENEEDNASDETYYAFEDVVNEDASEDYNEVDFVTEDVYYAENQDIYDAISEDVTEEESASNDAGLFGYDEVISVQQLMVEGKLTAGHARAILAVPSEQGRLNLAQKVVDEHLTVRQTENLAPLFSGTEAAKTPRQPTPQSFKRAARQLRVALNTNVKVKRVRNKNKIEIEFADEDDLARLVKELSKIAMEGGDQHVDAEEA